MRFSNIKASNVKPEQLVDNNNYGFYSILLKSFLKNDLMRPSRSFMVA